MKIGLVLSGGGGKGAYELGVWKALKELGIDKYIDIFSGTSIGAFNAILFAQDDIDAAEKLWEEVTMDKLAPISKSELLKKGFELFIGTKYINVAKKYMVQRLEEGSVPKDGAIDVIETYLDIKKVKERKKICYAACTQLPELTPKYFRVNDYSDEIGRDIIIASASLPRIYDCTEVLGCKYIDGGVVDNTPIQPVYGEGCDIIIVVLLSKEAKVDRAMYPNTKIIELFPKNLSESVLKGTLNLDAEAKRIRIKEGYEDTINLIEPIMALTKSKMEIEDMELNPTLYKLYKKIQDIKNKFMTKGYKSKIENSINANDIEV